MEDGCLYKMGGDIMKVMSLDGGLLTYRLVGEIQDRHITSKPPKGRKVRFLNDNGREFEREVANQLIEEGEILTVKEIFVGTSSSTVEFMEYPGKEFNTVMFEDVEVNEWVY